MQTPLESLQQAIKNSFGFTDAPELVSAELFLKLLKKEFANTHGPILISDVIDVEEDWFEGTYKLWMFEEKCCVGIKNITFIKDFSTSYGLTDSLSIDYVLSGGNDLIHSGKEYVNKHVPRVYVSSYDENTVLERIHRKGESIHGLGLWMPSELLLTEYGLDHDSLSSSVKLAFSKGSPTTVMMPLTGSLKKITLEILELSYQGKLADKFLHAKITELLCHTVACLREPQFVFSSDNTLRQRKSKIIGQVLKYVKEHISHPIHLDELANSVGMSTSSLAMMFKTSYGITLGQYIRETKLTEARELIRTGKLTILEAALKIGYENQSSFGRAYKQLFDHPPKRDLPISSFPSDSSS